MVKLHLELEGDVGEVVHACCAASAAETTQAAKFGMARALL